MNMKNISELKEISTEYFMDIFKCHKKIAKEVFMILKDYKENKIFYKFDFNAFLNIKFYLFDNGELFKIYKLFCLEKTVEELCEYNIKNNFVVKEKIKNTENEIIKEYSVDGKLLLHFYNFGKNIEFYTWDEKEYILKKIEYYTEGKMLNYEEIADIDDSGELLLVTKDAYTHMYKQKRIVNIKDFIRPDRYTF